MEKKTVPIWGNAYDPAQKKGENKNLPAGLGERLKEAQTL